MPNVTTLGGCSKYGYHQEGSLSLGKGVSKKFHVEAPGYQFPGLAGWQC